MSSTNSSQDSLHKQPKKKGIKSSLGRFFSKKEKAKAKEHGLGMPGSGLVGAGELSRSTYSAPGGAPGGTLTGAAGGATTAASETGRGEMALSVAQARVAQYLDYYYLTDQNYSRYLA